MAIVLKQSGENLPKRALRGWAPSRQNTAPSWNKRQHPVDRLVQLQSVERSRFAIISFMWATVTQSQRAQWGAAVADYKSFASNPAKMPSNAYTLFMYVNLNRFNSGSSIVTSPPTPVTIPSFTLSDFSVQPNQSLSITFESAGISSDWNLSLSIQPQVSAGNMRPSKHWYRIYLQTALPIEDIVLSGEEYFPFGNVANGLKTFLMGMIINRQTGQQSDPVTPSAISAFTAGNWINQALAIMFKRKGSSTFYFATGWIGNFLLAPTALHGHIAVQISSTPSITPNFALATEVAPFSYTSIAAEIDLWYKAFSAIGSQPPPQVGNAYAIWTWATDVSNGLGDTNKLLATGLIIDQAEIKPQV